jgi:hypothetical protein
MTCRVGEEWDFRQTRAFKGHTSDISAVYLRNQDEQKALLPEGLSVSLLLYGSSVEEFLEVTLIFAA